MADAYTTADVDYRWKGGDDQGIEIVSAEMAQFDLVGVSTRTKAQTNSKGMNQKNIILYLYQGCTVLTFYIVNADGKADRLFWFRVQVELPCLGKFHF